MYMKLKLPTANQWNSFFWTAVKFGTAAVLLIMSALLMVKFGKETYENILWLVSGIVFEIALWALIPDVKRDVHRLRDVGADLKTWWKALGLRAMKFPWGKVIIMLGLQLYAAFAFVSFATNMISTAEEEALAVQAQVAFVNDTTTLDSQIAGLQAQIETQNKLVEGAASAMARGVVTTSQKSVDTATLAITKLTQEKSDKEAERDKKKLLAPPKIDEKTRITASFDKVAVVLKKLIPGFPELTGADLMVAIFLFAFVMLQALLFLSFPALPSKEDDAKDWFEWADLEKYIYAGLPNTKLTRFATDEVIHTSSGLSTSLISRFKTLLQTERYEDRPMIITKQGGTIAQWDRDSILKVMKMQYKSGKFRE